MPIQKELLNIADRRRNFRSTLEMITRPLLGSRHSDWSCFEYEILDVSQYGLRIAVDIDQGPKRLGLGELLSLHVGFGWDTVMFDQGIVAWLSDETTDTAEICGIEASFSLSSSYELWFSTDICDVQIGDSKYDSGGDLFRGTLEQCVAMKKGISEVLFSISDPASGRPEALRNAARYWQAKIDEDVQRLEECFCIMKQGATPNETVDQVIPSDELKCLLKSDVGSILAKIEGIRQNPDPLLGKLRELETAIRSAHNTIVLLWACYLSYIYKTT